MQIQRQKHKIKEISLIPLINVIFLLLIFFMVAGNVTRQDALKVAPPLSHDGKERRFMPVILYLDKDGNLGLNADKVQPEDLQLLLKEALGENPNQPVTIRADKDADASKLVWLMGEVQKAGGDNLSVVTTSD